jgi:hypothetical protein
METKWLEDFVSLAETRSFSRSAQLRHVTQPAFSRRIQSLEAWAGNRFGGPQLLPDPAHTGRRNFVDSGAGLSAVLAKYAGVVARSHVGFMKRVVYCSLIVYSFSQPKCASVFASQSKRSSIQAYFVL